MTGTSGSSAFMVLSWSAASFTTSESDKSVGGFRLAMSFLWYQTINVQKPHLNRNG
jgi:hypothetical protein